MPPLLYGAVPLALAPVLGNPLAMAAHAVDAGAPWPTQVLMLLLLLPFCCLAAYSIVQIVLRHLSWQAACLSCEAL
jgi:hypothetical protein